MTLATTHLGSLKELASHTPGMVNASLQFDAATLTPTYRFLKGVPGRSYGLAIARRLGVGPEILADAEARVPDAERSLDALLAAVEERERELRMRPRQELAERTVELDSLIGAGSRSSRRLRPRARRSSSGGRRRPSAQARQQARAYLLEARQRVEEALGAARGAADDAARGGAAAGGGGDRGAGRGDGDGGEAGKRRTSGAERWSRRPSAAGDRRERGRCWRSGPTGKLVVACGAIRMVVDRSGRLGVSSASSVRRVQHSARPAQRLRLSALWRSISAA